MPGMTPVSDPTAPRGRAVGLRRLVVGASIAILIAGCGAAAVTPSPSPSPVATPTPDPHLTDPADVGAVFAALSAAGLHVTANNADAGGASGEPRKRINATYASWPLILSEFSSAAALAKSSGFTPDATPAIDQAPFTLAGLNILIEFGPHAKNAPTAPDPRFTAAAQALVDALDPYIGPLSQSSIRPLVLPGGSPGPSASPTSSAPGASPSS